MRVILGGNFLSQNNRRVVKYRKPIRINIGVIVFMIIFLYIVVITFQYFNKEHITIYEVTEKSIADDNTCYGVILRDETLVNTSEAGYINYYVGDGEKIAKNSTVYTVDSSGEVYDMLAGSENENELTKEDSQKIRNNISSFQNNFTESNFSQVEDFKYDIENTILELTNVNMLSNLNTILQENESSNSFQVVKAAQSGIISYSMDGLEDLTVDQINKKTFEQKEDHRKQLRTSKAVEIGSPVYKLVTSEDWSIIIPLTSEQYKKVSDKDVVTIAFAKDNLTTKASISTFQKSNVYYAKLDLNKYMIRFLDDRFIEVELIINSAEGLKIPVSSILKKKFYQVPLSYFTEGGDSGDNGLVKEIYSNNGEVEYEFTEVDMYYKDEEYGYVDSHLFKAGDWIRNAQTQDRYQIKDTKTLEGVYNVNKGYCVFRRIEKEYENQEYCIVKADTQFGLSVYDHIVVNADMIKDKDIIY